MQSKVVTWVYVIALFAALTVTYIAYRNIQAANYAEVRFKDSRAVQEIIDRVKDAPSTVCNVRYSTFDGSGFYTTYSHKGMERSIGQDVNGKLLNIIVTSIGFIQWADGDETSDLLPADTYYIFERKNLPTFEALCKPWWIPDDSIFSYPPIEASRGRFSDPISE